MSPARNRRPPLETYDGGLGRKFAFQPPAFALALSPHQGMFSELDRRSGLGVGASERFLIFRGRRIDRTSLEISEFAQSLPALVVINLDKQSPSIADRCWLSHLDTRSLASLGYYQTSILQCNFGGRCIGGGIGSSIGGRRHWLSVWWAKPMRRKSSEALFLH
jgi:hypothetical protein